MLLLIRVLLVLRLPTTTYGTAVSLNAVPFKREGGLALQYLCKKSPRSETELKLQRWIRAMLPRSTRIRIPGMYADAVSFRMGSESRAHETKKLETTAMAYYKAVPYLVLGISE